MERNRIRKYEAIWSTSSESKERGAEPIPEGFVAVPMEILPVGQREQLIANKELYDYAYQQAIREANKRLFCDWTI
ncbi:MAG: hypothetical protein ACK56G_12705 [Pirellulaceae bacterium]|jgi:hypothetical protein